jgi:hypothetical protein
MSYGLLAEMNTAAEANLWVSDPKVGVIAYRGRPVSVEVTRS